MGFGSSWIGQNAPMTLGRVKRFIYLDGQRRNFLSWQQKGNLMNWVRQTAI
jgi:hypothetical protein